MGKKAKLILVIFTIYGFFQSTLANENENPVLIDEDTVEIGDYPDDGEVNTDSIPVPSRVPRRDSYINVNGKQISIGCKTARNVHGECMTFGECYPIFRLRETPVNTGKRNEYENRVGDELKGLYRGISGPCSSALLDTISNALGTAIPKQNYVCCPTGLSYSNTSRTISSRVRPPGPVEEPTGYQSSQCGRVLAVERASAENYTEVEGNNDDDDENDADSAAGRIVNGRVANRGEFPWAVALMMNGRQFCGGSLIGPQHVLTAAHCVYFMNRGDINRLRVQIGDHNIYSTSDGRHEVRGVSNVYYHRSFNMKTIYDDVSVIRLASPVSYNRMVQPICLSTNTWDLANNQGSVAGWGQLSDRGQQSSVLRTVNVRIWHQPDCVRRYRGRAPAGISRGMVCAGGNGYDSCKGDSGGPMSIRRGSRIEQIGIVSWGIGCGSFPGVYTRVDQYLQWINKNRR